MFLKKDRDSSVLFAEKRVVKVEVWPFLAENLKLSDSWVRLYPDKIKLVSQPGQNTMWLEIETLEGTRKADLGDYIVKGIQGEFYPCKPNIFALTYNIVGHKSKRGTNDESKRYN